LPIGGLRRPYLLPADTPVPDVPGGRNRILDRDLKAAGIQKVDEPGRIVDVHALRVTFVTWLTKAGVLPRVAQALMRHSTIDLTMNTYTDPRQLDMAGAISKLPPIPLSGGPASTAIAASPRAQRIGGLASLHQSLHQLPTIEVNRSQILSKWQTPNRTAASPSRMT